MDSLELQRLAQRTRTSRQMGFALLTASGFLALMLFVPVAHKGNVVPVITVATSTVQDAFAHVPLEAQAAIIYDLATKETLYERNADAQLPLASLTKLLTVYAAFAELSPNTPITIPADAAELEAPHMFQAGQTFTLTDLARLTLTASLNDGAVAILEAVAKQQNKTQADALAGAAAALDLGQTYAVNGSGLDVSSALSGGYGSARDLALLAGALVNAEPAVAAATTERTAVARSTSGTVFTVKNTDPIVDSVPQILLSKTGYTDLAHGNLALVFDVGVNHPIAVVVLGSSKQARFTDGSALIAATFAHFAGVASL